MSAGSSRQDVANDDLLDLTGRTAVVTGGGKGIGLAIVRRMHEAGANVVVADLDSTATDAADELNTARADTAAGLHADVSLEIDAHRAAATAVEQFGAIDILVNNAAMNQRNLGPDVWARAWSSETWISSPRMRNAKGSARIDALSST